MPKIKECPHCNEVLICKSCDARFTPELIGRRRRLTDLIQDDIMEKLQKEAKDKRISINELLKQKTEKETEDAPAPKSHRRRASSDQ